MFKNRAAYSVNTKNKAVEMKLQGYSRKQVMLEVNKKTKHKQKYGIDGIKMERLIVFTNYIKDEVITSSSIVIQIVEN